MQPTHSDQAGEAVLYRRARHAWKSGNDFPLCWPTFDRFQRCLQFSWQDIWHHFAGQKKPVAAEWT
jgi:hypothetical protein